MEQVSYGVIRFIPDDIKQEVFNVGVVIHAPETNQIKLHLTEPTDTRLQYNLSDGQLFTYRKFAIELRKYIRSINRKFVDGLSGKALSDEQYLITLGSLLGHGFVIEKVNNGVTKDIETFAERIFSTHVTQGKTRDPDVAKMLLRRFEDAGLGKRIEKRPKVRGAAIDINTALGYTNGLPHYIQPISVQGNPRDNISQGALWHEVVSEVVKSGEESKFHFVIRTNSNADTKSLRRVREMLTEFKCVNTIDFDSELPMLISTVQTDLQSH